MIPLLLAAGIWRHLHHHVPLRYELTLWCIVFPLGRYATATSQLAVAQRISALSALRQPLAWIAMAARLAVGARCLHDRLQPRHRAEGREPGAGLGDDGAGQPPWPALPIGPTFTEEPEPSVTGSVAAPGQSRETDFVSSGGVTTSPVTRMPEPPESLIG